MNREKATDAQAVFIRDRWPIFEAILTGGQKLLPKEAIMEQMSKPAAEALLSKYFRLQRETERLFFHEKDQLTCETCKWREAAGGGCEWPARVGMANLCAGWLPDPNVLPECRESFRKKFAGKLCRITAPGGISYEGRPYEMVIDEGVMVRIEESGDLVVFTYGEGVKMEVVE